MADPGWARTFRRRAAFEHDQVLRIQELASRIRLTHSIHLGGVVATRMPDDQAGVRVVRKTHLTGAAIPLNVPLLLGLVLSWRVDLLGISGLFVDKDLGWGVSLV